MSGPHGREDMLLTAPPTPATTGLPTMADSDHCSQPHDHNNRPTTHARPCANHKSRAGQPQRFSMPLTNSFTALNDQYSETPTGQQAYLVDDSIVRTLQETWKGDKNGNHKNKKILCRQSAKINDITRQVRNLLCVKEDLIITHVGTKNLQRTGSKKLIDDKEQLCDAARAKADRHIVIQ